VGHPPTAAASGRRRPIVAAALVCLFAGLLARSSHAQTAPAASAGPLRLVDAAICESLRAFKPINRGAVFPVSTGKVFCYTSFENIPDKAFIHHHWYRRDVLITRRSLQLMPPRWASASSIQIGDSDKGPWRVEIADDSGNILQTLRFSVTD
jgi:hypothetical protein